MLEKISGSIKKDFFYKALKSFKFERIFLLDIDKIIDSLYIFQKYNEKIISYFNKNYNKVSLYILYLSSKLYNYIRTNYLLHIKIEKIQK